MERLDDPTGNSNQGQNSATAKACIEKDVSKSEHVDQKNRKCARIDFIQVVGSAVSHAMETFYYNLGYGIACRPWTVILCCFLISVLCGLGMIKFEVKDSSEPIWIPADSKVLANQLWVEKNFPSKIRANVVIVTADNILSPGALLEMYEIDQQIKALEEHNNSQSALFNFNWNSICFKPGDSCFSRSILELWEYKHDLLLNLQTTTEIANYLATVTLSPMYSDQYRLENWLGGLIRDQQGQIINAKSAKMLYLLNATVTNEFNIDEMAPELLWEKKLVDLVKNLNGKKNSVIKAVDVQTVRSFRDETDQSFGNDIMLLSVGIFIIILYVAVVIGNFNEVEHKVYLALIGVFGIGMAILVSYGIASVIGQFYGPLHPLLPFLLLGLGVDNMFVINEAWNNLTPSEQQMDLPEKVALTMKHAGVSVTVTSMTDLFAFSIGCTTGLPVLRSFCVYAALGILFLFILTTTFFVAWLTVDQRRLKASRDACCMWIKYYNFEPNSCSQRQFMPWIMRNYVAPNLVTPPIKAFVMTLAACLLGINIYGTYYLKTEADLSWFLPTDSYLTRFIRRYESSFDDGTFSSIYIGNISYMEDGRKLQSMIGDLESSGYVIPQTMSNWHLNFTNWLKGDTAPYVARYFSFQLTDGLPKTEYEYFRLLNAYVGRFAQQFYLSLRWNDTDPYNVRHVLASRIDFQIKKLESSVDETKCMNYLENLTETYFKREVFIYSPYFRNWESTRVIGNELFSNIGLAFLSVFLVTLLLVANIWVCILVCTSVIMTVVSVCGMMHFWDLTIDTLTAILLVLAIGLAIDYSAHIGHTFMTIAGTRNERVTATVATMGPAILHGGISTFLAFLPLATSTSYPFITFFKVFFLVVVFGLFNGLCFLPVLLSWFGPAPYFNATNKLISTVLSPQRFPNKGFRAKESLQEITSTKKVEDYIHSLPEQQAFLHSSDHSLTKEHNEDVIDSMLDQLENHLHKKDKDAAEGQTIHFNDYKTVLSTCEEYLCDSPNQLA